MTKARDTANLTGSGVTLPLLDIDAGTDIGAALVDADLMIVDDGAGGTNRKATMARLATYMGGKITGGSMVYLASSGVISNAANVSFTQFDATKYDYYKFSILNAAPATAGGVHLLAQVSTDGGSNYDSTNGNYHWNGTSDTIGLFVTYNVGSDTGEATTGEWNLMAPHLTGYTYGVGTMVNLDPTPNVKGGSSANYSFGVHLVEADVDAVKFLFSSGNIESGEIVMYGIANGS